MILRRPYAFLIKHFRLIHLIMFGLYLYITVRANSILNFFKDYINYNGKIEVISSNYINYFIFVSIFLIIVFSITIYFLMHYKKKPRVFYIGIILSVIVSGILFIYLYTNIRSLETVSLSGREIRLLRDFSRINFWICLVSSIPLIIRGLGFDIKKFNFTKDLKDLNLSEEDNEEIEVNATLNAENVKVFGRKTIRELGYYYKENKLIINIILTLIGVILIMMFPFNKFVVNRDLNEKETLHTNNFNIRVNSSYISERKRISENNSYIILKISVIGKTSNYTLDLDEFVLEGKNNKYIPSQKYYNYFTDIGVGYKGKELNTEEYKDYLLIYNINNSDKNSSFKLKYLNSVQKIKLNLETID